METENSSVRDRQWYLCHNDGDAHDGDKSYIWKKHKQSENRELVGLSLKTLCHRPQGKGDFVGDFMDLVFFCFHGLIQESGIKKVDVVNV